MSPQFLLELVPYLAGQLDSQFRLQQVCAQAADDSQIHPVAKRVTMIQHDHRTSARGQHAVHLTDGPRSVRCMVKNAV